MGGWGPAHERGPSQESRRLHTRLWQRHGSLRAAREHREGLLGNVQMRGNELGRQVAEPVGQRDLFVVVAAERLDEDQVIVAGVLDVVAAVAPDQADIAGLEVGGVGVRAGVEHRHPGGALHVVLPLIGIGVPVQLPHAARLDDDQGGRDRLGRREVGAVGDADAAAAVLKTSSTLGLPSRLRVVTRHLPWVMIAHSPVWCQCSSRMPPGSRYMFTPETSSEIAKSACVTSRAQPPACWRRGEVLNEDQKNGCVLTSVAGALIWLGNWLSITGFCGPVIFAPAGSPAVVCMPSWGRSGFPKVGVSWWGTWLSFGLITLSSFVFPRGGGRRLLTCD